jgi:2-desacetyl-2-hydroxyethyl bacteriochlorophyllide A dehydrogenase
VKAVYVAGLNLVEVVERPVPQPGPGQVRLKTVLAGICGSDTHAVAGHHPLLPPPYFPGHEATGVVDQLGDGVTGWAVGDRVIMQPNLACGDCVNCRAGRTNACQQLAWIGCDPSGAHPGAMAEYVVAPAANLFAVPDQVSDEQAVLVECLATPVHAGRIAGDLGGATVLVLGSGTIGLFCLLVARRAGAAAVVVSDPDPYKRERASRHGADAVLDPSRQAVGSAVRQLLGGPVDVVFDCVAGESSVRDAISSLRRSGTLLIVGVPPKDITVPLPLVQDWELRVQGCANYTPDDIRAAIALAAAGGLPAEDIIAGRYDLADAPAGFAAAALSSSGKVVLAP